ncbi:hypothetical protein B0T24DRAFT_709034 [Lasiosphaeria ovina]|uniref:Uncharacterized protein n=1 Tax=Lasiosphaeria ovina TaxID=92902 RepID=A0AAE0JZA3_9PEZI|nr:hypothetical protein B0T24DRAFT_709034 [Lasiosphaeria ovina]
MLNLAACFLSRPNDISFLSFVGQSSDLVTRTQVPFKTPGATFSACTAIPNAPRISANGKDLSLTVSRLDTVERTWRWHSDSTIEDLLDSLLFLASGPATYAHSSDDEPFVTAVAHANVANTWKGQCPSPPESTTHGFLWVLQTVVESAVQRLANDKPAPSASAEHRTFQALDTAARGARLRELLTSIWSRYLEQRPTYKDHVPTKDTARNNPYFGETRPRWRTFSVTKAGMVGVGPLALVKGDEILLVPGGYTAYAVSTPAGMREKDRRGQKEACCGGRGVRAASKVVGWVGGKGGGQKRWEGRREDGVVLLGEAYVRGWMDREEVGGREFEKVVFV